MQQWADEQKFAGGRRPGQNSFGRFDRRGPAVAHYQHSNRPTFDPSGRGEAAAAPVAAKKEFFGIAAAPVPTKPFAARVTRFDDSDDEGESAAKKRRHE